MKKNKIAMAFVAMMLVMIFTSVVSADVYNIQPHKTMVYNVVEGPSEVDLVDYDMVFILTTWQDIPANEDAALRAYVEGGGILVLSHDDYPHEYSKDPANDITTHFGITVVDPDNYFNSYINVWSGSHSLANGVNSVKSSTFGRLNVGSPLSGWTTTELAKWNTGNTYAVVSENNTGTGKLVVFGDEYAWESSYGWSGASNEQWLENILNLTTPTKNGSLVDICYAEWDYKYDYDPYSGGRNWVDFRNKFAEMGWDLTFNGHFDDPGCGNPGLPVIPMHVPNQPPPWPPGTKCCPEGSPNAGICYTPGTPEDGCCEHAGGCYDGNRDPEECRICYGGTWYPGYHCEEGKCIPEFSTIAIPVAAILGLLFLFSRRRKKE